MTGSYSLLFEDSRILVVCKSPGLLSVKDAGGDDDLTTLLERRYGRGRVFPVHRLDRGVGGVMVFARDRQAAAVLSSAVSAHDGFEKQYLAVASGAVTPESAILSDSLFFDERRRRASVVPPEFPGAKEARLSYRVLARSAPEGRELSLLRIHLLTGRTHQIRIQFSSRGYPLAGDGRYGAHDRFPGISLFSERLTFRHPGDGRTVSFTAPPPEMNPFTCFSVPTE